MPLQWTKSQHRKFKKTMRAKAAARALAKSTNGKELVIYDSTKAPAIPSHILDFTAGQIFQIIDEQARRARVPAADFAERMGEILLSGKSG